MAYSLQPPPPALAGMKLLLLPSRLSEQCDCTCVLFSCSKPLLAYLYTNNSAGHVTSPVNAERLYPAAPVCSSAPSTLGMLSKCQ